FAKIDLGDFLSKQAKNTFAGYALSQIKKARGLNKKIVNPVGKERKSVLAFCYVQEGQSSMPLTAFLKKNKFKQENCGLVNIAHMKGLFALFHHSSLPYQGVIRSELSNDICLSSVPKSEKPVGLLYFNKDAYSSYCKSYTEYWSWVENRNPARYTKTMQHGKNYDAKNMMHTFRLLHMAVEIAKEGTFHVRRTTDKSFLWDIRNGVFQYDDLVKRANEKIEEINALFETSSLPEKPNLKKANELLLELREAFYKS
ncbi:MAG: nucleotidyltransferase, partial [Bacteroidota bacterium]